MRSGQNDGGELGGMLRPYPHLRTVAPLGEEHHDERAQDDLLVREEE